MGCDPSTIHEADGTVQRWKTHRAIAVTVVVGLLICASTLIWFRFIARPALIAPLYVDPEDLDLGDVFVRHDHPISFSIRNRLTKAVKVSEIQASCKCTTSSPASFTVEPLDAVKVSFVADLTSNTREGVALAQRPWAVELYPTLDSFAGTLRPWTIRANVIQPLQLSDPAVVCSPNEVVRGQPAPRKSIRINVTKGFTLTKVIADNTIIHSQLSKLPDGAFELLLRPNTNRALGPVNGFVTLHVAHGDILDIPSVRLPFEYTCVADVRPDRAAVALGVVGIGDVVKDTLRFSSRSQKPFSVEAVESSEAWLRILRSSSGDFTLEVTSADSGERKAIGTFRVIEHDTQEVYDLRVPVIVLFQRKR